MRFKQILISAGLSLVLGVCSFFSIGANMKGPELVSAEPAEETIKTITFDTFDGLFEANYHGGDWQVFTWENITFRGRNIDTDSNYKYGYETGTGFSFRGWSSHFYNQTPIPGHILSVAIYTFSCQKLTVTFNVGFGSEQLTTQKPTDGGGSHDIGPGQNYTFNNTLEPGKDGMNYFAISCQDFDNGGDLSKVACVDKVVLTYQIMPDEEHIDHDGLNFTIWKSANSYPTEAGNYRIDRNVTASWTLPEGTTNLCLNGHYINGSLTVNEGSTLNLYDCNHTNLTWYITTQQYNYYFKSISDVASESAVKVIGGVITGVNGYAIRINGGAFNMYGGSISCNLSGVIVDGGGTFTMYGGSISYNQYEKNSYPGIGTRVQNGNFIMNGGSIDHNYNNEWYGGGVGIEPNGNGTINNGTITNNNSSGIWCKGNLTLNGGTIANNSCKYDGGVMFSNENGGALILSGSPVIKDNYRADNTLANLYFHKIEIYYEDVLTTKLISINGLSTKDNPIGFCMSFPGVFTYDDLSQYKDCFVSDDPNYTVRTTSAGALTLVDPSMHEHNWSYTASGAKITASCSANDCPITEGLTLTLKAPSGNMQFDGKAKVATFEQGYSEEAFPNPQIKYYKDDAEVTKCVSVGKYTAKVTFGEATASVDFEIVPIKLTNPNNPDVTVEVDDEVIPDNIELRVEVRTDVAEKDITEDYAKIQQMLENNEKIASVYDVKLVQIVGGVETVIQPSDIKPGLVITVRMAIPNGINMSNARILHIHSADDMEFVSDYTVDENDLVFKVSKLSEFAFITKVTGGASHGFCIGVILLIINILVALAAAIYVLLRLDVYKKVIKNNAKVDEFKEKITTKEVMLTFIATCALLANFILDLIVLIVHACPFTIIAFILGILLLGGIMFWYIRTRRKGEMTPVEEKSVGKVFKKKDK